MSSSLTSAWLRPGIEFRNLLNFSISSKGFNSSELRTDLFFRPLHKQEISFWFSTVHTAQDSTIKYSTVQYSTIQHTIESETYHHKHIDIVIVSVLFGTVDFGLCNSLVERYHCLKWCRFIFSVWKTIIFNCGFSIKFTCGII